MSKQDVENINKEIEKDKDIINVYALKDLCDSYKNSVKETDVFFNFAYPLYLNITNNILDAGIYDSNAMKAAEMIIATIIDNIVREYKYRYQERLTEEYLLYLINEQLTEYIKNKKAPYIKQIYLIFSLMDHIYNLIKDGDFMVTQEAFTTFVQILNQVNNALNQGNIDYKDKKNYYYDPMDYLPQYKTKIAQEKEREKKRQAEEKIQEQQRRDELEKLAERRKNYKPSNDDNSKPSPTGSGCFTVLSLFTIIFIFIF